jgi:hypothetical protein
VVAALCHQVLSESARQEIKKKGKLKEGGRVGWNTYVVSSCVAASNTRRYVRTGAPRASLQQSTSYVQYM